MRETLAREGIEPYAFDPSTVRQMEVSLLSYVVHTPFHTPHSTHPILPPYLTHTPILPHVPPVVFLTGTTGCLWAAFSQAQDKQEYKHPWAVIGSTDATLDAGFSVYLRKYPWGNALSSEPDHSGTPPPPPNTPYPPPP